MLTMYKRWEDIPQGLMTRTQLKAEGLKPAPEQKPVARISGRHDVYDLYDKSGAVPVRTLSEAQKAAALQNIERAQAALHCIDCRQPARAKRHLIEGRCRECHWEHRKKVQAVRDLAELSKRDDWLVLDVETTGLSREDEVISIAVVTATGEVLLNELVRPAQIISEQTSAVNGITNKMVADAAAFADLYPRLVDLLTGRMVLAYNADFDKRMLRQTCERYNLPVIQAEWECAMELYAAARNWRGRLSSLHDACMCEGVRADRFHEACADAQATRMLVLAVGGREKERGESQTEAAA